MNPRSRSLLNRTGVFVSHPPSPAPPIPMTDLILTGRRRQRLLLLFVTLVFLCACHLGPRTFEQNYREGLKLMDQGKFEGARSRFELAVKQSPGNFEAAYQLALADLKMKDDVAAYPILRNAEEHDRESGVANKTRLELAKLYLAAKQYDEAQK